MFDARSIGADSSGGGPVPFASRRDSLVLSDDLRARILLAYADGSGASAIASEQDMNRPKVDRCIDKGLQIGALAALSDLPRKGRPRRITPEARA